MNKLNEGDIVVGNEKASWYGITKPGCVVEVVESFERRFRGKLLEPAVGQGVACVGDTFTLRYEAFDLKESAIQENE